MKRVGFLLIILAICLTVAYGTALGVNYEGQPASAEEVITESSQHTAEIIFCNFNYPNGRVERKLQVYLNFDKLLTGLVGGDRAVKELKYNECLDTLLEYYQAKGLTAEKKDNFIDVTVASYEDTTELYIANGFTGYDENEPMDIEWGFLFNYYPSTSKTVFADINGTIIDRARGELIDGAGIKAEDITFIYNYGTKYNVATVSSNADKVFYASDLEMYIHEFVMNDATRVTREITLKQRAQNNVTWYMMVIIPSLILAGVAIVIASKRKG
jgi:hypothetical protein